MMTLPAVELLNIGRRAETCRREGVFQGVEGRSDGRTAFERGPPSRRQASQSRPQSVSKVLPSIGRWMTSVAPRAWIFSLREVTSMTKTTLPSLGFRFNFALVTLDRHHQHNGENGAGR